MKVATITNVAYHLPKVVVDNQQLVDELKLSWSADDIFQKTGIERRHIVDAHETAVDLGVAAAQKVFELGNCNKDEIDFLLFCTQSPDYFLPASACVLQERLGLKQSCGALDFNQGCSGYIYGLALAKGLIETGNANKVLLITAETYSKYINPGDRSTRTIFGDGAAATIIAAIESNFQNIGPMVFGTDGRGAQNLIVPAGGKRLPISAANTIDSEDEDGNIRNQTNLYMNGPEIFNFTLKAVPKAINELLRKSQKQLEDVDYFILHQANRFMLEHLKKKMKIDDNKFWIDMRQCGNTVSSTIPIALKMALDSGKIKCNDTIMLVGFGVGYSWGATYIRVA